MIKITRLGNAWVSFDDPITGGVVCLHIDSLRQEASDPLMPACAVVEFSSFTRPAWGEEEKMVVDAQQAKKAVKFKLDDETQIAILVAVSDGASPANLFEMVAQIAARIVLGQHQPMDYKAYKAYLKTSPRYGKTYMVRPYPASPTGRMAVWDVVFIREFGIEDGLFVTTKEYAEYRAGFMGGAETFPGGLYQFPKDFKTSRQVTGHDFLDVLTNLISFEDHEADLAQAESYRVP